LTAGDYMQLSVIDTGTGMDDETQTKIFDPFFTTKGEKGTGLGLSQVFGFIQRSGGAIYVDSKLGHGTEFTLYFPHHQTVDSQISTEEIEDMSNYSGHETLLVVDDEPALRDMLMDILYQAGYQVRLAEDGNHALEILAQYDDIAFMLSDVIMPHMDGFELANQVAKRYPHIKIQMASGFTDGLHSGVKNSTLYQNMLYKPYNRNVLLKRIRQLLDPKNGQSQNPEAVVLIDKQPLKPIEWAEQYETGIDQIDIDHKALVGLLNRCIEALSKSKPDKEIKAILSELQDYTVYHFQREEKIMQACHYPHLENHKQVHQLLIREVSQQIKAFELGNLTVKSLLEFIWDWLNNHILGMDKAIIPYVQGKM